MCGTCTVTTVYCLYITFLNGWILILEQIDCSCLDLSKPATLFIFLPYWIHIRFPPENNMGLHFLGANYCIYGLHRVDGYIYLDAFKPTRWATWHTISSFLCSSFGHLCYYICLKTFGASSASQTIPVFAKACTKARKLFMHVN
jgi:hypothetical protein